MTKAVKDPVLPEWATLLKPRSLPDKSTLYKQKRPPLEGRDEEAFLRTRCWHVLAKRLEQNMEISLDKTMTPCIESIQTFLNSFSTLRVEDSDKEETEAKSCLASGMESCLEGKLTYDPLLLPVILLDGPSFALDRSGFMRHLQKMLTSARKRSAVVLLQALKSGGNWMDMIVDQCHALEPSALGSLEQITHRRLAKASPTEILTTWARRVQCFDEIVVFLEVSDTVAGDQVQDLLHLLMSRRSWNGIPFCLVLMGPLPGRRAFESRSSAAAEVGYVLKHLSLPLTVTVLDEFWKVTYTEQKFPIMFPPMVIMTLFDRFRAYLKSIFDVVTKLKQALAYYFTQRGSFLVLSSDDIYLNEQWKRIAWYCLDNSALEFLAGRSTRVEVMNGMHEMNIQHAKAHAVFRIVQQMQRHHSLAFDPRYFSTPDFASTDRKDLLRILLNLRQETQSLSSQESESDNPKVLLRETLSRPGSSEMRLLQHKKVQEEVINLLNELILLVGRSSSDSETLAKGCSLISDDWTFHGANRQAASEGDPLSKYKHNWAWSEFPPAYDWDRVIRSLTPEPRRATMQALTNALSLSTQMDLSNVSGRMLFLIRDYVMIQHTEWFDLFFQDFSQTEDGNGASERVAGELFACGIRFLKIGGFISDKRTNSRRDVVYEKNKLVWCAID